jgi:hypothetical protein
MGEETGVVQFLKRERERLMKEVQGVSAALAAFGAAYGKTGEVKATMSPAARAKIGAAQKARSAKAKNGGENRDQTASSPTKRVISAASRKKMAAAQKARWAKVKGEKKSV